MCLKLLLAALTLYNSKLFRPSKKQDAKMAACYCQVQVGCCFVHFGVRRRLCFKFNVRIRTRGKIAKKWMKRKNWRPHLWHFRICFNSSQKLVHILSNSLLNKPTNNNATSKESTRFCWILNKYVEVTSFASKMAQWHSSSVKHVLFRNNLMRDPFPRENVTESHSSFICTLDLSKIRAEYTSKVAEINLYLF